MLTNIIQLNHGPQLSPDGGQVASVRIFIDIMTDSRRSNIWIGNADGSGVMFINFVTLKS